MPQLIKGGKWVFGWAIVRNGGVLAIPPDAWQRYGFTAGQRVIFIRGSRRSGGFAVAPESRWPPAFGPVDTSPRVIGIGKARADHTIIIPKQVGCEPGQRLLAVFGSGRALGFVTRGPILQEARNHPELETFS